MTPLLVAALLLASTPANAMGVIAHDPSTSGTLRGVRATWLGGATDATMVAQVAAEVGTGPWAWIVPVDALHGEAPVIVSPDALDRLATAVGPTLTQAPVWTLDGPGCGEAEPPLWSYVVRRWLDLSWAPYDKDQQPQLEVTTVDTRGALLDLQDRFDDEALTVDPTEWDHLEAHIVADGGALLVVRVGSATDDRQVAVTSGIAWRTDAAAPIHLRVLSNDVSDPLEVHVMGISGTPVTPVGATVAPTTIPAVWSTAYDAEQQVQVWKTLREALAGDTALLRVGTRRVDGLERRRQELERKHYDASDAFMTEFIGGYVSG